MTQAVPWAVAAKAPGATVPWPTEMDLTSAARTRVRDGITADGRSDADRILAALRDQRLPLCGTTDGTAGTGAQPDAAQPTGAAPSPGAPLPSSLPSSLPSTAPSAVASASPTGAAPTSTGTPGVDCREAK